MRKTPPPTPLQNYTERRASQARTCRTFEALDDRLQKFYICRSWNFCQIRKMRKRFLNHEEIKAYPEEEFSNRPYYSQNLRIEVQWNINNSLILVATCQKYLPFINHAIYLHWNIHRRFPPTIKPNNSMYLSSDVLSNVNKTKFYMPGIYDIKKKQIFKTENL